MPDKLLERTAAIREFDPYPADGSTPDTNPPAFRWLLHDGVAQWQVQLTGRKGERLDVGPLDEPILALPRRLARGQWRWQYVGLDAAGQAVGRGRERSFTVRPGLAGFLMPDVSALARKWKGLRPRILGQRIAAVAQQLKDTTQAPPLAFSQLQEWCRLAADEPLIPEPADFGPYPSDSEEWNRDWIRIYSAGKIGSAHAVRFALSYLLTGYTPHLELAQRWAMHLVGWNPSGTTGEFINDEASMPMLERLAWVYDWLHPHWSDWQRRRYLDALLSRGQDVMLKYRRIGFAAKPFTNHMCRQLAFLGGAGIACLGEIPQAGDWLRFVLSVLATSYPSGSWGGGDGGWAQGVSYWSSYMSFLTTFIGATAELGLNLAVSPYYRNTGYFAIYHLPPYAPRGGFGDHGEGGPGFNHKLVVGTFGQAAGDAYQTAYAAAIPADLPPAAQVLADTTQPCPARRWDAWFVTEVAALLLLPDDQPTPEARPTPEDRPTGEIRLPLSPWERGRGEGAPEPTGRVASGTSGCPGHPHPALSQKERVNGGLSASFLRDLPAARLFPSIGWMSMHSGLGDPANDAWLEFKSGPFGSISHSHADQNSFNLSAFGQALLIDSGYYPWYGSPHDELWTRQTWAHNAVLIDGHGQPPHDWLAKGRIEAFDLAPPFVYSRGEAADAYNRPADPESASRAPKHCPALLDKMGPATVVRRASRSVLMINPDAPVLASGSRGGPGPGQRGYPIFVVLDWIETADPVKFQWLAHAVERMELLDAAQPVSPSSSAPTPSHGGVRLASSQSSTVDVAQPPTAVIPGFNVHNGPARLAARFAWPAALRLAQTDQFILPPEGRAKGSPNQWHLSAETIEPATTARFVTVLIPHRGESLPEVASLVESDGAAVVRIGSMTLLLPRGTPRGTIRHGDLDAEAALLVITADRLFAAEATRLTASGKTLIDSADPKTVALRRG